MCRKKYILKNVCNQTTTDFHYGHKTFLKIISKPHIHLRISSDMFKESMRKHNNKMSKENKAIKSLLYMVHVAMEMQGLISIGCFETDLQFHWMLIHSHRKWHICPMLLSQPDFTYNLMLNLFHSDSILHFFHVP